MIRYIEDLEDIDLPTEFVKVLEKSLGRQCENGRKPSKTYL